MSKPFQLGTEVAVDLSTLIDTRLLIQANSGGGKSRTIRRLLEQTHGHVQHLVIDPEGEFASLRERFDYVLAGKGGDTPADPRSAKLLAERLLELRVSAILDIYELKAHDRIRFVRHFVDALVNAPKTLWHPVMVVVDEAHVFCPQVGEAESASAIIDLCTRGRKRGFCAVLATQRLSKLHKDAAAECNNKLIGRTGLDVDMKRAGDELGLTTGSNTVLRSLEPGEFYAFGPALCRTVTKTKIGDVMTHHPKAGGRIAFEPPAPSAKVKALLPKLSDLPAEQEQREKTVADLKAEIAELKRRLSAAPAPQTVSTPVLTDADRQLLVKLDARLGEIGALAVTKWTDTVKAMQEATDEAVRQVFAIRTDLVGRFEAMLETQPLRKIVDKLARVPLSTNENTPHSAARPVPRIPHVTRVAPTTQATSRRPGDVVSDDIKIDKCGREILATLSRYPDEGCTIGKIALLSKYAVSGTFRNNLAALRSAGFMTGENNGVMKITPAGLDFIGGPAAPMSSAALCEYWLTHRSFDKCARSILAVLLEHPNGIVIESLAAQAGYEVSGTFRNNLAALRTAGVLKGKNSDVMYPSEELVS